MRIQIYALMIFKEEDFLALVCVNVNYVLFCIVIIVSFLSHVWFFFFHFRAHGEAQHCCQRDTSTCFKELKGT